MLSKRSFLTVVAGLAIGILFILEGRPAAAGDGRAASISAGADVPASSFDDRWKFHDCFDHKRDAQEECRRLEHDGWRCKVVYEHGRWCVYKRRGH